MKLKSQDLLTEVALLLHRKGLYANGNLKGYHQVSALLYDLRNPGKKLKTAKAWNEWNRDWQRIREKARYARKRLRDSTPS